MDEKFDFDAPDCTCGYKSGIIARNMCGHVPPCPIYERWKERFFNQPTRSAGAVNDEQREPHVDRP